MKNRTCKPACLDTSELTSYKSSETPANTGVSINDKIVAQRIESRALAKYRTNEMLLPMIDVGSRLTKQLWKTWHCNEVFIQEGNELRAKYCRKRWCVACDRRRMANLMLCYKRALDAMQDPYFMTLTVVSVPESELSNTHEGMTKSFGSCKGVIVSRHNRGKSDQLSGIRVLECNYNERAKTFNPHYHLIVDGYDVVLQLRELWLKKNKGLNPIAQPYQKVTEGSILELFKYFTKPVTKASFNAAATVKVFESILRRRTVQSFGNVKKTPLCETEGYKKLIVDVDHSEIWGFESDNKSAGWFDASGTSLCSGLLGSDNNDLIKNIEDDKAKKKNERRTKRPIKNS